MLAADALAHHSVSLDKCRHAVRLPPVLCLIQVLRSHALLSHAGRQSVCLRLLQ